MGEVRVSEICQQTRRSASPNAYHVRPSGQWPARTATSGSDAERCHGALLSPERGCSGHVGRGARGCRQALASGSTCNSARRSVATPLLAPPPPSDPLARRTPGCSDAFISATFQPSCVAPQRKPWSEMADRSAFSRPANFSEVRSRPVHQNVAVASQHDADKQAPWLTQRHRSHLY